MENQIQDLLQKIKKIESLIAGATSQGERQAAELARERVNKKLEDNSKIVEYSLYTNDTWHKKLLLAICRKYGIRPYRYRRQKYTTVMVKIDDDFLNKILWPEYLEYSKHLEVLVEEITDSLIDKIHKHSDEDIIQGRLK